MAVSNQEVAAYLAANPGLTDAQIAQTAAAAGVSPQQLAEVTGIPLQEVQQRVQSVVADQILASSNTSAWTGDGFGSAKANAEDMAKVLSRADITDINQLGVRTVEVPATYATGESGDEILVSAPTVATEYFNKSTGQPVEASYDRAGGNIFSGTFKGKDSTGYGVQFDASGKPVFYTQQGASTSDAGKLAPFLGIASLALGLPGIFGSAINSGLGLGFGAAGTAALGGAAVGGLTAGLTEQDILKGVLLGGAGGYLSGSGLFGGTGAEGMTAAEQLAAADLLGSADVAGGLSAADAAAAGLGGGFGNVSSVLANLGFTPEQIAAIEGLGGADVAGGLTSDAASAAGLGGGFNTVGLTADQLAAMEGLGGQDVAGGLTSTEASAAGLGGGFTGVTPGGLTAAQLAAVNGLGGAEVAGGLTAAEAATAGLGGGVTGAVTGALSGLTTSQIANLVKAGVGLLGAGGAVSAVGNNTGSNTVLQAPTQQQPQYTPGYYNQLQQYYNAYLPQTPRDVVTPLQQWYNSSYGA